MSISILEKPNAVDFRGNGLKYKVSGSKYIITNNCVAKFGFRRTTGADPLDTFIIPIPEVYNGKLEIVSGYYGTQPLGITPYASAEVTAAQIAAMPQVAQYYNVYAEGEIIWFESHEAVGLAWEFETENIVYTGGAGYEDRYDDAGLLLSLCPMKKVEPNYYITAKVEWQGRNIATKRADVNADGVTSFDFGEIIPKQIYLPSDIIATEYYANPTDLTLNVGFSEHYSGSDYPYTFDEIQVLPGKINFNMYPTFSIENGFLNDRKILNVSDSSYINLTYLVLQTLTDLILSAKFYKIDGTDTTEVLHTYGISVAECVYFADILLPDILAGKTDIYRIDISANLSSDKIVLYVNETAYNDKQFAYINSFGFFEMIHSTTDVKKKISVERETNRKYVPIGYDVADGEFITRTISAFPKISASLGTMSKREADAIIPLLHSEQFYELKNNQFVKCELIETDFEVYDETENLSNIEITYRYSHEL